jgi:antitoxin component of RelBE/YafQ-DinJ toxin-antitoxin module
MRSKKLSNLLQFRVSDNDKARLAEIAEQLGLDQATLARLSLREGITRIRSKLPITARESQGR